jgi:large subunit ribosomal protein L2
MGTPLIQQRRGKGSPTYRVPEHSFRPGIRYRKVGGTIRDLVRHPITGSPLAEIEYDDRAMGYVVAVEGMRVGQRLDAFVMPISRVPDGSEISSIETSPMAGPRLCRSPGTFATVISKAGKECVIRMPSKKTAKVNQGCMAMVGRPAGEGRREKPWVKAGKKWIAMHRRGRLYPRTKGRAMNAVDHPFGGGYVGLGKPKSVSRDAPPGAKVGSLASRRTGRKR